MPDACLISFSTVVSKKEARMHKRTLVCIKLEILIRIKWCHLKYIEFINHLHVFPTAYPRPFYSATFHLQRFKQKLILVYISVRIDGSFAQAANNAWNVLSAFINVH